MTAAHAVVSSDVDLARRIQTIDSLTEIFGFARAVAEEAYDAIGWTDDISVYYHYILDQGLVSHDAGGPVIPIEDCPHLPSKADIDSVLFLASSNDSLDPNVANTRMSNIFQAGCSGPYVDQDTKQPAAAAIKDNNNVLSSQNEKRHASTTTTTPSAQCGMTTENWLCLVCGVIRCSRYQNGHCRMHYLEQQQQQQHAVHVSLSDLSVWCHSCQNYLSTQTGATGQVLHHFVGVLEECKHFSPIG